SSRWAVSSASPGCSPSALRPAATTTRTSTLEAVRAAIVATLSPLGSSDQTTGGKREGGAGAGGGTGRAGGGGGRGCRGAGRARGGRGRGGRRGGRARGGPGGPRARRRRRGRRRGAARGAGRASRTPG